MAYTTINKSTDYFDTKIHDGTGVAKTLAYDFEVDMFWTKMRNQAGYNHMIFDVVRGNNIRIRTDETSAEGSAANTVSLGNASGVSLGSDSSNYGTNKVYLDDGTTQAKYVGWGWRANGAGSSNTDGSITSTVSANTTSGFSIVSFTGTNATGTVGHGLGATPKIVLYKNRTDVTYWYFTTTAIDGSHDLLLLPAKDAVQPFSAPVPTSSVLNLIANNDTNGSSDNIIAYCFAEKQGFSKFGTYVGNGNSDGTFVYCGFKPSFVLVKMYTSTANGNWTMHDNRRSSSGGFNHIDKTLYPHLSNSEDTGTARGMDMLSNGFKFTGNDEGNTNGDNYIFMAFAEAPLVGSNNVPCTAR